MNLKVNFRSLSLKRSALLSITIIAINSVLPIGAAEVNYRLTVKYQKDVNSKVMKYSLICQPAPSSKKSKAICSKLLEVRNPFKEVPQDSICSEVFGSSSKASVKGVWAGKKISTNFSQNNGCEIERWEKVSFLFFDK